ncbi:response regulator receiver domain [Dickeya dianthicola]|uniref:response regulator receiver domain n=1 Tax=Dickeya dianthicola TaxID=204039 RepID=UPI001F36ED31|nr:response regulator receiver domain [Dickeya dianthicola]
MNNVVAIDDKLSFVKLTSTGSESDDDFDSNEDGSGLGAANTQTATPAQLRLKVDSHQLDYQDLSLSFAEYGINCSGFIPDAQRFNTSEKAATKIMESARRADITILDWDMDDGFANSSKGTLAKTSIEKILVHDKEQHGRLRLIVIYTAEPNQVDIAEEIRVHLHSDEDTGIKAVREDKTVSFESPDLEFCQIVVIEKKVSANDLREEVIKLFTQLTIGLLPNAALSALGELRDRTHHILHTFNKDLDPAYLSHILGLLSSPKVRESADEVAFDYAAELIAEEFKSILQISQPLKSSLNKDRIKLWLDYINKDNESDFFSITVGDKSGSSDSVRIKKLLDATKTKQIKSVLEEEPRLIIGEDFPHNYFEESRIEVNIKNGPVDSHEKLSIIECKRRDGLSLLNQKYEPNIKLGSIVKNSNNEYYVCLQPLCDSVRLSCDTGFLFLKVDDVTGTNGKFSHVIQSSTGMSIKLMIRPNAKNIYKFTLKYNQTSRTIKVSHRGNGDYVVENKKHDNSVEDMLWVGEFKNNVAQAISNNVAASISRVGLDTNEWLRLSASSR